MLDCGLLLAQVVGRRSALSRRSRLLACGGVGGCAPPALPLLWVIVAIPLTKRWGRHYWRGRVGLAVARAHPGGRRRRRGQCISLCHSSLYIVPFFAHP